MRSETDARPLSPHIAQEIFHWGLWRVKSKTILKLISSQLGLCILLH